MTNFSFALHNTMHAGIGWSRQLGEFVRSLGWTDYLIVVDAEVKKSEYFLEIKPQLDAPACSVPKGEPTYDLLQQMAEAVRKFDKLDGIIGIGGGSTMDVAKALACLRTNWMPAIHYRGFDKLTKPGVPVICIPTTAGSGSEVTPNAVFIDAKEKRKLGINGRYVAAQYAIIDAEWTGSCPREAAASSRADALVHALESYMCRHKTPISNALSCAAFDMLTRHDEHDQYQMLGAYFAGAALCNSGSGVAGAISYPLGVHFGIPHGIAGGMFIADVVHFNAERGFGFLEFKPYVNLALSRLEVPPYLTQWGLRRRDLDRVMELIAPVEPSFAQNPVPFTLADAREMINKHLED